MTFHRLLLAGCACLAAALTLNAAPRERLLFNDGWKFQRGDAKNTEERLSWARLRPWVLTTGDDLLPYQGQRVLPVREPLGEVPYARPDFPDTDWRSLTLPHDFGIEGPFQQELSGDTGKLPWFGPAWYRKTFTLPAEEAGRVVYLEFDGAMSHAAVWLNGELLGGWPYGYTSWRLDLTKHLRFDQPNTLAVRLNSPRESSRWYPGAGLYRNVWLLKTSPVHVAPWGVGVTTPSITTDAASVDVGIDLRNTTATQQDVSTRVALFAADGTGQPVGQPVVTSEPRGQRVHPGRDGRHHHTLTVPHPKLWSLQERHRYVAEVVVEQAGQVIDRVLTPFGIRTLEISATGGFTLNGVRVPLNGVCNHHDLGALGAAVNWRALERQLEILQAMGCNAIRTSHNPPTPELLELCDRMGFLLQVEAFDCWALPKKAEDYSVHFADWHEKDLRAMIRRDRNHPSVVQWSIGNEVREQWEPDGWRLATRLAGIVREEDRTRPVVSGFNGIESGYNGFQTAVDVVGYNYKPAEYARLRATHPHLPIMGAETASTISSRGEYFFPVSEDKAEGRSDFQMSSYDLYTPPWAHIPETEWRALDELPGALGEFVWTGFDYIGEPTPYNADSTNLLNYADPQERAKAERALKELGRIPVPSRSSYFGIIDLAGFPKDRYYHYQARWRPELPMAHLLPHWTWPGREGEVTPVHLYTSGDEAELFLNGLSLGRKKKGHGVYRLRWDDVRYAPGELRVVTWKNGAPWAETSVRTAGAPARVELQPDRVSVAADAQDLLFVTARILDAQGNLVPRSQNVLTFQVEGPGEVIATDNGDATSFVSFQAAERPAFNGLALAIIRPKAGQPGSLKIRVSSPGLASQEVIVQAK